MVIWGWILERSSENQKRSILLTLAGGYWGDAKKNSGFNLGAVTDILFAIGRSVQAIVRGYVQEYQTSKGVRQ